MIALYKSAPGSGNVSLQDRPEPVLDGVNNVLVRVDACAVCGMDFHIYHGKFPCTPPFIMGHELIGVVELVEGGEGTVRPGDRVTAQPHLYACGHCPACKMGLTQLCAQTRSLGIHRDGAMASYVAVPESCLHIVPRDVPTSQAAILEPFSMVLGNFGIPIERQAMETAVIMGAGQVGLLGVAAARACGAKRIILCGRTQDTTLGFPAAEQLGATALIDTDRDDAAARVLAMTGNVGADIVLEASGASACINAAMAMVKAGGLITVMGGTRQDTVPVTWDACLRKAVRVCFHMKSNYQYMDRAIALLAEGSNSLAPVVTGEYSLSDWQAAFQAIEERRCIKNVLLLPN